METWPWCKICQCFLHELEWTLFLCFSAFQCHRSLPTENRPRPSNWCTCSSHLADPTLVHHSPSSVSGLSPSSSTVESSTNATSQWCLTPSSGKIKPDGLQALRQSLQQRNVSGKAVEIILKSWSAGTQKQYSPYITQWTDFCSKRESNPYDPPLTAVLDFLVTLHDKGLSYTTINTARSAISAFTVPRNNTAIGSHPLISRFMKGIFKGSPPTPRYQSTWDVKPVLTYLSSLHPVEKLELKTLTLKLIMLIALVSAQRGQSLHILDTAYMKEAPDVFEFLLSEHIKQRRPGYKTPSVILKAYPADSSLCVVTCLKEYLKRTKPLRGSETKLFISLLNLTSTYPGKLFLDGSVQSWRLLV